MTPPMTRESDIAIIGVAGRFPGACNTEQFWINICDGVESVAFPDDADLLAAGIPMETITRPGYVKARAEAPDIQNFDAPFFGYTPREAESTDPQIRLYLETAHAALENAGYNPYGFEENVGVYATTGANRYIDLHLRWRGDSSATSSFALSSMNYLDYVASTVSYKLNLRGPAITLATACSSSLVTVHLAAQSLRNGECDVALAGGVEVEFPVGSGYQWDEGGPVSKDGHVRPFDVKANGTLFGTGVGVVVLKRLTDAVADRDTILAVIRGSAINNDGSAKAGFTAPSVNGQAVMIAEAMAVAGVHPEEIGYVEAHATGTPLGDPIEVAALTRAYRTMAGAELPPETIALSSVKANVGHLGHAAGIASLIKTVYALDRGHIPPTVNFTEPNPKLEIDRTPFRITDRLVSWRRRPDRPRFAGVSSFGVGGTNCHIVLGEAPLAEPVKAEPRPRIVVWSAKSEAAEAAYRETLARHLSTKGEEAFPGSVFTLQEGRRAYPIRRAVVAATAAEAARAIASGEGVIEGGGGRGDIVFAFPGQGAQQPHMGAGLYGVDRAFTEAMDECLDLFAPRVREAWRSGEDLSPTDLAQPLLFSVGYALAAMLRAQGVTPKAVIGHSIGELAAATVAGVLALPDAAALVTARAAAMLLAPPGAMLAVDATEAELAGRLPSGVSIAVVNAARQTVLAGSPEDIDAFAETLQGVRATRLATSGAFHSPLMAPSAAVFAEAFDGVTLSAPGIPLYSAALGRRVSDAEACDPSFWADQVASPVRFDRALAALLADGPYTVLETGPGHTLTALGRAASEGTSVFVPVLPRRAGDADADRRHALAALARVWGEGIPVSWAPTREGDADGRVPVPGYAYQRARHWVELPEKPIEKPAEKPAEKPMGSPFSVFSWAEQARPPVEPRPEEDCLVLLPETGDVAVVAALQLAGLRPVIVRPGTGYRETGGEFRVRLGDKEDLGRVLAALAQRGIAPRLHVHALTLRPYEPVTAALADRQLTETFHTMLALVQAGGAHLVAGRPPAVLVLTSRSVDVTGAEPLDPMKAGLHGFARSIVKESPAVACRVIDVADAPEEELAAELACWPAHDVVALRGSRRWVRREEPFTPPEVNGSPLLRRQGVYLLTGGLGGLGLAVARGFAGTGLRPRLALLGRTGQTGDDGRLAAHVAELESLGAEVKVVACDVTDRRAVARALDTITARFGPISGVVHLAGIAGDGLAQFREPAQAGRVLAPKVQGTLVLAEALAGRAPLDFFVCFSSRAASDGLVGSTDYAAANAFQDAYAMALRKAGIPALSINWPSWAKVGMAAEHGVRRWSTVLGTDTSPLLDEHRIQGEPVLPGTGHIDLVCRAYRELTGHDGSIRLKDIVFHQVMTAAEPRRVEIRLHQDGRFESWSRPAADPAADPVRHASGRVSTAPAAERAIDVAALRARHPHLLPPDAPPQLFSLGPRWDNVPRTWALSAGDTREMLLELALHDEYAGEAAGHAIHPTLLDSATSAVRRPEDGTYLPFLYNALTVHAPLPAAFLAHVRRQASGPGLIVADVDLLDAGGRLLAEVSGYTMRRVTDLTFLARETAAEPTGDGIDPRNGVRLFATLLRARHPGQVAVQPNARPLTAPVQAPVVVPVPEPVPEPVTFVPLPVPNGHSAVNGNGTNGTVAVVVEADGVETRLRTVWAEAIGDSDIALDADFFDLGGNSLSAVGLMSDIREAFGVDLSIAALFDYPTIRSLAGLLREQGIR